MELAAAMSGRVLVIDDDEIAKSLLKEILERARFSVWALLAHVGATQLIERRAGVHVSAATAGTVAQALRVISGPRRDPCLS